MIENLPAKAVFRAVEMERRMLEDDLSRRRILHTGEALSVLDFCHFLEAVRLGVDQTPSVPPAAHVAFYRQIVEKLVKVGELPARAKGQFDATFLPGFLKALAG
jgi:hypothetical protein